MSVNVLFDKFRSLFKKSGGFSQIPETFLVQSEIPLVLLLKVYLDGMKCLGYAEYEQHGHFLLISMISPESVEFFTDSRLLLHTGQISGRAEGLEVLYSISTETMSLRIANLLSLSPLSLYSISPEFSSLSTRVVNSFCDFIVWFLIRTSKMADSNVSSSGRLYAMHIWDADIVL